MQNYEEDEIIYDTRMTKIIEFISENPCPSKESIIKAVVEAKYMSRMTAINKINYLESQGIIVTFKDENNARDIRVILDKEHIFMQVFDEFTIIEKLFKNLPQKILGQVDSLEKQYENNDLNTNLEIKLTEISSLQFDLYFKIVNEYLTRSLFEWSSKIKNKEILKMLNGLVFTKLKDLQNNILQPVVILNMSKNVYNYHNRNDLSFPVIDAIKKIGLNDFKKKLDDTDIARLIDVCSLDENQESEFYDDDEHGYDDDNYNDLSAEDKSRIDGNRLAKLYKKYPYENIDIEEQEYDDDDDNENEQKK